MKEKTKYISIVKMPDGSQKEFVGYEYHEVGTFLKGGEVTSCRNISKIKEDYSPTSVG